MIFNEETIKYKTEFLDTIEENENILHDVLKRNLNCEYKLQKLERPWNPGGGCTLFECTTKENHFFLKVKSKSCKVESKLESEDKWLDEPALQHEFGMIERIKTDFVPRLIFFEISGGFQFLALEWLVPFEKAIDCFNIDEIINIWGEIYSMTEELYKLNIVHTDIHEKNICFRNSTPILCDFEESRSLKQNCSFAESLDVSGRNKYGDVGDFPLSHGLKGRTCLNRLYKVFQEIISYKLTTFLEECQFSCDCEFNKDTLQQPDQRIYQSVMINGKSFSGQRIESNYRYLIINKMIDYFYKVNNNNKLNYLDIGCNMGRFCIKMAKSSYIAKSTGVDAFKNYVTAARALAFLDAQASNVKFTTAICGEDSLKSIIPQADIISVLSVYHHIKKKTEFLQDLKKLSPKAIIFEFAVQDRFYPERKSLDKEITYVRDILGATHITLLGHSNDYSRPIFLYSCEKLSQKVLWQLKFINLTSNNFIKQKLKGILQKGKRILKFLIRKIKDINKTDDLTAFKKAQKWLQKNTINNDGVAVNSKRQLIYPEVTGYYIPTLLTWGKHKQAKKFADYLVSIQNNDGSWSDPEGDSPYTFDTGQILKGLISLVDIYPQYKESIERGINWIILQGKDNGQLCTPDTRFWKLPFGNEVPEAIHLYCLDSIKTAGIKWNNKKYLNFVEKTLKFYLAKDNLTQFNTLSHFHAYIIEALTDLGETATATKAMLEVASYQKRNGAIPAYNDHHWICSTGMFQYALIWYKLGNKKNGDLAFNYAVRLQNKSGGWYGSYGLKSNYFPKEEISWAVKYFLDALYWKIKLSFNLDADIFPAEIRDTDGRVKIILDKINEFKPKKIVDLGCGKGRFLKAIMKSFKNISLSGMDLSEEMLKYLPEGINKIEGSLLKIPVKNEEYDFAICVEALEHAVDIDAALEEMRRIVKGDGILIIIDKNIHKLGKLELSEWETWFDKNEIKSKLQSLNFSCDVIENISYDDSDGSNELFIAWIAQKGIK